MDLRHSLLGLAIQLRVLHGQALPGICGVLCRPLNPLRNGVRAFKAGERNGDPPPRNGPGSFMRETYSTRSLFSQDSRSEALAVLRGSAHIVSFVLRLTKYTCFPSFVRTTDQPRGKPAGDVKQRAPACPPLIATPPAAAFDTIVADHQ